MDKISFQQIINHILLLGTLVRLPPTLDNETFAIIYIQPSKMQSEHCLMIANFRQLLYFADCLSRKNKVS